MGPPRKSRSVNKRYSDINEVSPSKDVENGKSSNNRKRKLSDMLGPQWSKEELTRFYDAYRKHGKDWKKVAAAVRHRSVEMVESLYTMNRAYLSLPEGTASVIGLIAMMTDHYSNMAGSDSEQESDEGAGTSRKPQKRARGKLQPSSSKGFDDQFVYHSPTAASGYSYPALMKKKRTGGSKPRPVGKRTPRFPVSHPYENFKGEKFFSPARGSSKISADTNNDDYTHKIVMALTEASQRGSSPQGSRTPNRRSGGVVPSPARNAKMNETSENRMANSKFMTSDVDDEDRELSMEADTGELYRHRTYMKRYEQVGGGSRKGRIIEEKKVDDNDSSENESEDIREACSGTEEGQRFHAARGKLAVDGKINTSSSQGSRRSKKALFKRDDPDENPAFDALNTLAALSTLMTDRSTEDEPFVQIKDDIDDHVDESGYSEVMPPAKSHREKRRSSGLKSKGHHSTPRDEVTSNKLPKLKKASHVYDYAASEAQAEVNPSKPVRKKSRVLTAKKSDAPLIKIQKSDAPLIKIQQSDAPLTGHISESQDAEAKDLGKMSKNKRSSQTMSIKMISSEHSTSIDPKRQGSDAAQTATQVLADNNTNLSLRVTNRRKRKMDLKKLQLQNDPHDPVFALRDKLSNCLSNKVLRRWCKCEWFYSAIDYPWYSKKEFVEYLYHVGLGHVRRLTRVEWGVIRSSLGKPRRFSQQFLKEEKKKLKQYRDSVRKHYTDFRDGAQEGLPTDLARPLSVGQRVIAIHPKTREVHDGSVLTVDQSRCRVQFDRPELGVEFVMDIDCMPLNPLENMPALDARHVALRTNEQIKECIRPEDLENLNVLSHVPKTTCSGVNLLRPKVVVEDANQQNKSELPVGQNVDYSQICLPAPIQSKEADVQALAELTRALDKKEAVVMELRGMNDDVLDNHSLKESEPFQKQYANVIVLLQEANQQVSSSLFRLRQRNTYQGTTPLGWPRSIGEPGVVNPSDSSPRPPYEAGSHVREIIETSRSKARTMVDVAMKAVSSLKCRENTFDKIEEAIDFVNEQLPSEDPSTQPTHDAKSRDLSDRDEAQIPSELISQCVATLLMIQKCTERQFPPAAVAQVLESAVTGLKPCCSQNLPVYSEIQKCMGMIRNQILALIPT